MTMDVKECFPSDGSHPYIEVTSSKREAVFTIQRTLDGYALFKIHSSKGPIPKELSGVYTSPKMALKDLEFYLTYSKKSNRIEVKEKRSKYRKSTDTKKEET